MDVLKQAEIGRAITKGVNEIMPHTAYKGLYQSSFCNDINNHKYGCVLKYYCELLAEGCA